MSKFWRGLYHITGAVYIPKELQDRRMKILHMSDTPSMIYSHMIHIVKKIRPQILIHTGDLVDDVKLEFLPQQTMKYKSRANSLLKALSPYVEDKIIIVPGNHDNDKVLHQNDKIQVYKSGSIFKGCGLEIGVAHDFKDLPLGDCNFYMYGHCKGQTEDERYLNGIEYVNILLVERKEIVKLLYPSGTDNYRFRKSKIGI